MRINPEKIPDIPLCRPSPSYRPFRYPWAQAMADRQHQIHWIPQEAPMGQDVRDYAELPGPERALIDNILRMFTQSDVDVTENYMTMYTQVFRNGEVNRMLLSFGAMETVHISAYAFLLDTLGKTDAFFHDFVNILEMRAKHDLMRGYRMDEPRDIAITLALAGAFGEGLQLFSQFAMLLNFKRFGRMTGMGQIVAWSVRDETLHVEGLLQLFRTFLQETRINPQALRPAIEAGAAQVVALEDAFIDRAFELGPVRGLTPEDMKAYIRYTADFRLKQLGYDPIYHIPTHPLPWLEVLLNAVEHANFFETRATEYSKGTTSGTWENAFAYLSRYTQRQMQAGAQDQIPNPFAPMIEPIPAWRRTPDHTTTNTPTLPDTPPEAEIPETPETPTPQDA